MSQSSELARILRSKRSMFKHVLPFDLTGIEPVIFDLSAASRELQGIDITDVEMFSNHIFSELRSKNTPVGVGRYAEDRSVYRHRALFDGEEEKRSVHLGIDLFAQPGTTVHTPLPAEVHSFANNETPGDYGPTIILTHRIEDLTFYTLYGHLALQSLTGLQVGKPFDAGEVIGKLGKSRENGGWPPHLHFQIITDMGQCSGDFPGVAAPSQLEKYLELCPDPNLILRIPALEKEQQQ